MQHAQASRSEQQGALLTWALPTGVLLGKGGHRDRTNNRVNSREPLLVDRRKYTPCLVYPPDDGAPWATAWPGVCEPPGMHTLSLCCTAGLLHCPTGAACGGSASWAVTVLGSHASALGRTGCGHKPPSVAVCSASPSTHSAVGCSRRPRRPILLP